jgi:hypothetical protein
LLLLLETRLLSKMRDLAERLTPFRFLQSIAYWSSSAWLPPFSGFR